jgi:hypothetical protein
MWLTIVRLTRSWSISFPIPRPGTAVSLAMTVRLPFFCRTSSSMTRSGVPTPMNPPTMSVAPSGIFATASAADIAFIRNSSGADFAPTGGPVAGGESQMIASGT